MAAPVAIGAAAIAVLYAGKRYFQGPKCQSNKSLKGKTVVITGGNTGIGKETAVDLAGRGARVIIGCRNLEKGKEALKEIQERSGSSSVFLEQIDLASLESVRTFSDKILNSEPRLDILINNAGVMACPYQKTEDGFEMQFGVNHLGHFLLTLLLLDRLKRSQPSRIINVSSSAHRMGSGKINFDDIHFEKSYSSWGAYFNSKLANVLFTSRAQQTPGGYPRDCECFTSRSSHYRVAAPLISVQCSSLPLSVVYFQDFRTGSPNQYSLRSLRGDGRC